jgi:site-specific recombinase XerD
LKDVSVAELTPGRLESTLNELSYRRKWSPATFNRHRSTLSAMFQCAIHNGKAENNPARSVAHRQENNQRVRYLTAEEETRLMMMIRARWPEREQEIVVALHSGMRRSEQFQTCQVPDGGLKWEHINFKSGVLRLPRSKSGKARPIPINSVLRQTLLAIQRTTSPYVFDGTDPNKWFVKACQLAGVNDFHWHDFRHTFASRLVMAGVPIRTVAELLGHSEITTTMRYAHLAPGHLADAVECLAAPHAASTSTAISTEVLGVSEKAS